MSNCISKGNDTKPLVKSENPELIGLGEPETTYDPWYDPNKPNKLIFPLKILNSNNSPKTSNSNKNALNSNEKYIKERIVEENSIKVKSIYNNDINKQPIANGIIQRKEENLQVVVNSESENEIENTNKNAKKKSTSDPLQKRVTIEAKSEIEANKNDSVVVESKKTKSQKQLSVGFINKPEEIIVPENYNSINPFIFDYNTNYTLPRNHSAESLPDLQYELINNKFSNFLDIERQIPASSSENNVQELRELDEAFDKRPGIINSGNEKYPPTKRGKLLLNLKFVTSTNCSASSSFENYSTPRASGQMVIGENKYQFRISDLKDIKDKNLSNIGQGGFGVVSMHVHKPSNTVLAVKRVQIRIDVNLNREIQILRSAGNLNSEFIIKYFGSLKHNGEVWIAMELMKTSVNKITKHVYYIKNSVIPENITKHVSFSICSALHILKTNLNIIHRDVKPSNMLVGEAGEVKICDFGISGPLVESLAKSKVGCQPYMAPERLDSQIIQYNIQSDVWSFGLSIMELATGEFPFKDSKNQFELFDRIIGCDPPQIESNQRYSVELQDFVNSCLKNHYKERPYFGDLLKKDFLKDYNLEQSKSRMVEWMESIQL